MKFTGNIYYKGKMRRGTLCVGNNIIEFIDRISNNALNGTIIPMPVNAHIHTGDSFISAEPEGSLPEIVGPGGLKHRELERASKKTIIGGISNSNRYMEDIGTLAYFDFRESGLSGISMASNARKRYIRPVILGRPYKTDNIENIIDGSDGFGLSSISDIEYEEAKNTSEIAIKKHKIMALHFSENIREDIDKILDLKPDLLIHGIAAEIDDLNKIRQRHIPVAITPRSNIFYGKRPDYGKFIKSGIELMLGTDNVFITEPDIFSEMDFLYRYQRFKTYISPGQIMNFAIDNPLKFLEKAGIKVSMKYIYFKNVYLNEYQIVTKRHYFKSKNIINFE
ncbi:N-ethylammeline chlorohydrolase [Ferroplasma sp.]|uniref:N-ethylammeline chlorohydrolase n=1 Tax=Ferroplasma sp. TaxID=2591003 RepID=UPI00307D083B